MNTTSAYVRGFVIPSIKCYGLSAILAFGILSVLTLLLNKVLLYYVGGILLLMSILAPLITQRKPKEKISPSQKAIFITGCDTGFGHMLALRLDDIGFHVFAGCLFPDGDGATALRKSGSTRLHVVSLDVTSDLSVQKAVSYVEENIRDNLLWAVVNNAGIAVGGELNWISMETIQRIFEVNTLGVVRISKAFLAKLRESKGRIVTVASLAGVHVSYGLVPYSMSKRAAISFCDGLRLEMYKWGIQVIAVNPSFYRTPIANEEASIKLVMQEWEKVPKDTKEMYGSNYIQNYMKKQRLFLSMHTRDPGEVVSAIEDAITELCPEYSYSPGSSITKTIVWFLQKLPKSLSDMLEIYFTAVN